MCMYVCMHMYIYTRTCTHMCVYIYIYINVLQYIIACCTMIYLDNDIYYNMVYQNSISYYAMIILCYSIVYYTIQGAAA